MKLQKQTYLVVQKTQQRQLRTEQNETNEKPEVNSFDSEMYADSDPHLSPVVLLMHVQVIGLIRRLQIRKSVRKTVEGII